MSYVNETSPLAAGRGLFGTLNDWRAAYARRRTFRRTLRELQDLTDRELADLGLHRASLRAAAHEAVYG